MITDASAITEPQQNVTEQQHDGLVGPVDCTARCFGGARSWDTEARPITTRPVAPHASSSRAASP
jgi:hypothetical protein